MRIAGLWITLWCCGLVPGNLLHAAEKLEAFGQTWSVPAAADWLNLHDEGVPVLRLNHERGPLPGPRRPIQFALAQTPDLGDVTVDADVMPLGRSLLFVFAYRDAAHFDYAHLSIDTATAQPHHNGIFHVYDGERVRISAAAGPPAFSASKRWYHVQLTRDAKTGKVQVNVDGQPIPALTAVDVSLAEGKVGIGSFDETAQFKNVRISAARP